MASANMRALISELFHRNLWFGLAPGIRRGERD
jgi:hypothetical protein